MRTALQIERAQWALERKELIEKIQLAGVQLPQALAVGGGGAEPEVDVREVGAQGAGHFQQITLHLRFLLPAPALRQGPVGGLVSGLTVM